jgi:hypothetical protein
VRDAKVSRWAIGHYRDDGSCVTTLLSDRELNLAMDSIAAGRAGGRRLELRLATERERQEQDEQDTQKRANNLVELLLELQQQLAADVLHRRQRQERELELER